MTDRYRKGDLEIHVRMPDGSSYKARAPADKVQEKHIAAAHYVDGKRAGTIINLATPVQAQSVSAGAAEP